MRTYRRTYRRTYSNAALSGRLQTRAPLSRIGVGRVLLLLAGLVPLLLAGCATQEPGAIQLAKAQVFTWPYYGATKVNYGEMLDPASLSLAIDAGAIDMIYVGLVSFNGNLQVQGDAATSWDVDNTGTVYTFHLRPNMKFSDGTALTAQDFAYSINRALDPTLCTALDVNSYGAGSPDPNASSCVLNGQTYLNHVLGATAKMNAPSGSGPSLIGTGADKGLTVVDPLTLQIRLDVPISYFLQTLAYPTSYAVEQSFVEKYPGGKWVDHLNEAGCSGPFKVNSYGDGSQLTLEPNPYWEDAWGKSLTLDRVVRPLVATQDQVYDDYRKGSYDEADVPGQNYATARGQGDFQELPGLITRFFGISVQNPPFRNTGTIFVSVDGEKDKIDVGEAIRRAFALALNKQLIVDRFTSGAASPTDHFIPKGMPGYDPALKNPLPDGTQALTGNQAAAQKLLSLAQATCPSFQVSLSDVRAYCRYITGSSPLEIDVHVRSSKATEIAISTAAATEWNNALNVDALKLHVNVQVVTDKSGPFFGELFKGKANAFQMWSIGWLADYTDPQDWLSVFFTSNAPNNWFGLSDPAMDTLLGQADVERDSDKRMQLYNQAEQTIVNKAILIPYQQEKILWRVRPWVRGFSFNSLGLVPDVNWTNIAILQH